MTYPFSAGTAHARTRLMPGACDCHLHVYSHRVPAVPGASLTPPDASIDDYRLVQARMGTSRAVLVTPSTYGADNSLMLEGLAQLGEDARGVAVITGDEPDALLEQMHRQGVRGGRINLSLGVTHGVDSITRVASRIAPLGWHLQLLMPVDQLWSLRETLERLSVPLVFDHFARLSPEQYAVHPVHALLCCWMREERAWVKISGAYIVSADGRVDHPGIAGLARSFMAAAPEQVVWGSDWPHATASAGRHPMPDDAQQIDELAGWAQSPDLLEQILVRNPQRLYDFPHTKS